METLGIVAVAGVVVREVTQIIVRKAGWSENGSAKRLVSVVVAVGVSGLLALSGLRPMDEVTIAAVWAASWAAHAVKQRL